MKTDEDLVMLLMIQINILPLLVLLTLLLLLLLLLRLLLPEFLHLLALLRSGLESKGKD